MKNSLIVVLISICFLSNCAKKRIEEKGFPINYSDLNNKIDEKIEGINKDSINFNTRPSNVLLTGISNIRLTTIYKVNQNKSDGTTYIGTNKYLNNDYDTEQNEHFMPGLEAINGYNLVNISLFNTKNSLKKLFFDKSVLIKTLYYPSFSKDTLFKKELNRNYFLVSVYDNDSNKDGFINFQDLRHFYLFNQSGDIQKELTPNNYSVVKSEYDPENDYMYVFARLDENKNGQIEDNEPINIFWIDLKEPTKTGLQY